MQSGFNQRVGYCVSIMLGKIVAFIMHWDAKVKKSALMQKKKNYKKKM